MPSQPRFFAIHIICKIQFTMPSIFLHYAGKKIMANHPFFYFKTAHFLSIFSYMCSISTHVKFVKVVIIRTYMYMYMYWHSYGKEVGTCTC